MEKIYFTIKRLNNVNIMVTAKVKFQKMDSKQDAGELVSVNLFIGHLEATVSNEVLLASFHQSRGCYTAISTRSFVQKENISIFRRA